MDFEPDYDVYNEAPPEDEDDETNLDDLYPTRPEQITNTSANEQAFEQDLAELRANLREMRLVLAEIGRAMGPWSGRPDTF
jgi:hypothetical protein